MPGITLDLSDAVELAEPSFLADWLSGEGNRPRAAS